MDDARVLYKTHVPTDDSRSEDQSLRRARRFERRERAPRQSYFEPVVTALPEIEVGPWAGWERWMRAHLDNERVQTEASIGAVVRDITDGTLAIADALEDKVLDLQAEVRELKAEVTRLTTIVSELRLAQANEPIDLPKLPLRSMREVN
jgi:hypothetical protein